MLAITPITDTFELTVVALLNHWEVCTGNTATSNYFYQ